MSRAEAYKAITAKLLQNPDDPRALVERHWCLTGAQRSEVNLALARRAVELAPDRFEAMFNLASAQMAHNDPWSSLEGFKRAFEIAPNSEYKAATKHHIGLAYHDLGRIEEALEAYRESLALNANEPEIHRSIAIAKLANGQLGEGLFEFEVEHYQPWRKPIFQSGLPRWRGEDLADKTIIIAHEQGFGDTLQFCRFIPRLKAKRVLWSGPDTLTSLIAENIRLDGIVPESGPFEADVYASPLSACGALGANYCDVDGSAYLDAAPMTLPARGRLKVGIAWRGSSGYARDADRSLRIERYAPFWEIPGCAYYSLQVGEFADDIHHAGLTGFVADLTPTIKDWRDTARAIAAMDVVVTCDTSTAHLAGALGKPVLIMLNFACCWRWMRDSETTPWYNSATLYRQNVPGDWDLPISQVATKLRMMANAR
jgi:hypothetical protein